MMSSRRRGDVMMTSSRRRGESIKERFTTDKTESNSYFPTSKRRRGGRRRDFLDAGWLGINRLVVDI